MNELYIQQQLWGHRPLWLWITGWGGLSLLLLSRRSTSFYLQTTLSGILLGFAFPPFPTTIFAAVAWIPLLYVWKNRENQKDVFLFGWNAFLWWNLISTYWVCNTALVAGIVAIGLNSLLMATVFWIASLLSTKVRSGYHFLLFASSWISFEYVHYFWDIQWPWLTLGNSLASFPPLAQWYAVTGVFGGSLWILALNWLGWTWICRITEGGRSAFNRLIPVFLLFLLPIGISLLMLNSKIGSSLPEVEVAVIQPNYEPHYEKFTVSEREVVDRVLSLSEEIVNEDTDFLVFPETVFDVVLNRWSSEYPVVRMEKFLEEYPDLVLVSGFSSRRILPDEEEDSPYTRRYTVKDGTDIRWEGHNSAIKVVPDKVPEIYYKSKLVPGAEFFPFRKYLPFLTPLVTRLGGSYAGLRQQEEREAFQHPANPDWATGPIICYESVFGAYVSGYVKDGATMLFIMTNDGWWDDTPGHKQHLAYASLRAIEQRKPIARAANTGISAFIDPYGRIRNKTKYEETIAIKSSLRPNDYRTIYSRYGDVIARLSVLLFGGFVLYGLARAIR